MLADRESSELAEKLIQESCQKQQIEPEQLVLHADRGSAMTSKTVGQLLVSLGVRKSHSRPHVSNDNPFSEAQFKTLKYHPSFPERFENEEEARSFCRGFFRWYNNEHHHGGICLLTPYDLHHGGANEILEHRNQVLREAYEAHPERFVQGQPDAGKLPEAVWINPPVRHDADDKNKTETTDIEE